MKLTRITAALLCLVLLLGLAACKTKPAPAGTEQPGTTEHRSSVSGRTVAADPLAAPKQAESYDDVRQLLAGAGRNNAYYGYYSGIVANDGIKGEDMEMPTEAAPDEGDVGAEDTGTNIQVAGVDEADIVKTDGSYIYCLTGDELILYKADGANSARVSSVAAGAYDAAAKGTGYPVAMLIGADRVAVFVSYSNYGLGEDGEYYDFVLTKVQLFDVSDKAAPKLIAEDGADGYYQTARLLDGRLYLITTKYAWAINEDTPVENYIPAVYCDGVKTALAPDEIWICPNPASTALTAVTSLDLQTGAILDKLAFTDNTETVYMDKEAIYLARPVACDGDARPGTVITSCAKEGLAVRCGDGALEILEMQAPGGKRMTAKAYLAGKKIEVGTVLGNRQ